MSYVRWFGFAFGILAISLETSYPSRATQRAALFLVALLALGNVAISTASHRCRARADHLRVAKAALAFDALVISGLVWLFAFEQPYVTWALLFLLPMEGALRYRLRGALTAAGGVAVFFVAQTMHRAALFDASFDLNTFVFVVGLATLVAGVTGAMADSWHAKSRAFEAQSIQLAEVDRLKDRFLAITSHEIRGPLAAIIAAVDTLRRRAGRLDGEQAANLLEMVSRQSRHLARLVDDLTVTSQLQAGKLVLRPEWTELDTTIRDALEAAGAKRRAHRLEVLVEPLRCEHDGARVGQIVRNLVENAYKYTPERTRVTVAARRAGDGIVIEVADEGGGIPPEMRERLFEAFTRIEGSGPGPEGVGLGLYVVSELVAAMGGHVDLASSSGGTSFTIHLPCSSESGARPHLDLVVAGDGEGVGSRGGGN